MLYLNMNPIKQKFYIPGIFSEKLNIKIYYSKVITIFCIMLTLSIICGFVVDLVIKFTELKTKVEHTLIEINSVIALLSGSYTSMLESYVKLQKKINFMLDKGDYMYNVSKQQQNLFVKVCETTSSYPDLYQMYCN